MELVRILVEEYDGRLDHLWAISIDPRENPHGQRDIHRLPFNYCFDSRSAKYFYDKVLENGPLKEYLMNVEMSSTFDEQRSRQLPDECIDKVESQQSNSPDRQVAPSQTSKRIPLHGT